MPNRETCKWCFQPLVIPKGVNNKQFCTTQCRKAYDAQRRREGGYLADKLRRSKHWGDPVVTEAFNQWLKSG